MKVSVIMPIFLGKYSTAARDRNQKLIRAINSVCTQITQHEIELICIIDNCEIAKQVLKDNFHKIIKSEICTFYFLEYNKQKTFNACIARNAGIENATGEIICYLDSDDYFGINHIEFIANNFIKDWVYFDAKLFNPTSKQWGKDNVNINSLYHCGTCNIAHKKTDVRWKNPVYSLDDWCFISDLKKESDGVYIGSGEYYICHWFKPKYDI